MTLSIATKVLDSVQGWVSANASRSGASYQPGGGPLTKISPHPDSNGTMRRMARVAQMGEWHFRDPIMPSFCPAPLRPTTQDEQNSVVGCAGRGISGDDRPTDSQRKFEQSLKRNCLSFLAG